MLVRTSDTTRVSGLRLVGLLLALHGVFLGYALFLNYLRELIGERKPPYNSFLPAPTEWRTRFRPHYSFSSFSNHEIPGTTPLIETNVEILLKEGFVRLFSSDLGGYLAVGFIFVIFSSLCIWKALQDVHLAVSASTLAITLLSYPSLLLLHRGDIFLVSLPLLLGAFLLFNNTPIFSAMMLGAACSISPQILVFLLVPYLLLSASVARRYIVMTALTYLAFSMGAFAVVARYDLSVTSRYNFKTVAEVFAPILITPSSTPFNIAQYGHSLFESLTVILGPYRFRPVPGVILSLVLGVALLLFIVRLFNPGRVSALSSWLMAACISCLYFPSSEDSRLLLLVPGLLVLVRAQEIRRWDYVLGVLIVVAMAPKPWGYIGWYPWANAAHWLTPFSLVAVIALNTCRTLIPRETH